MKGSYRLIAIVLFVSGAVLALIAAMMFIKPGFGAGIDGSARHILAAVLLATAGFDIGIGYVFLIKSKS